MNSRLLTFCVMAIFLASCEEYSSTMDNDIRSNLVRVDIDYNEGLQSRTEFKDIKSWMAHVNERLEEQNIELTSVEYLGAEKAGATVFFKDTGNKSLSSDYVPNDPRNGNGSFVPYIIDGTQLETSSGMSQTASLNAMVQSMRTWDAVTCSNGLELPLLGVSNFDVGFVQNLLGFGGTEGFFPGIIVHGGILPKSFFDSFEQNGGDFILGVTFTITYIDDIDENDKGDVAVKEIYINDNFNWQDAPDDVLGNGIYDLQTVILHETGHALSQAHFGKVFSAGDKLHYAPAALMNAGYTVARREVTQTDNAGHCTIWGEWPLN